MPINPNVPIQSKGGLEANVQTHQAKERELMITTDSSKLYVGKGLGQNPVPIKIDSQNVNFNNSNFTSNNVSEALNELFQFANSGKNNVADSIGYATPYSDTFATLAGNIDAAKSKLSTFLPNAEQTVLSSDKLHDLANKLDEVRVFKKRTKLRKLAASSETVTLSQTISPEQFTMNVLRLNGDNVISPTFFVADFNNGDQEDFFENTNVSFTNNYVEIPVITTTATYDSETVYANGTVKVKTINFSGLDDYRITNITNADLTYQTLAGAQIIVANDDIPIGNVGDFQRIRFLVSANNISTPAESYDNNGLIVGVGYVVLFALSFDGGTTWYGKSGVNYVPFLNINNNSEWSTKGITTNALTTIVQAESQRIEQIRNNSNTLRFAYQLRRFNIGYSAYLTRLEIDGFLKGTLEPAGNSAIVSYNNSTKTATVTFFNEDTYQINWIDKP